ncbi:MAG: phosphoribosylformylglycinamidine cyclo-ligase, partial [Proteobacteria bacterium]
GFAHITGSGFYNIPRINQKLSYTITELAEAPPIFSTLQARAGLGDEEMYSTFNMGVGFVIACQKGKAAALVSYLKKKGEKAWRLGEVSKGGGKNNGAVHMRANGMNFSLR